MRRAQLGTFERGLYQARSENTVISSDISGAVAGSPGTLPTQWFDGANNAGSLARASIALSTQLGRPAIDITVSGTPANYGNYYLLFRPLLPAVLGQYFAQGAVVSLVGGSLSNVINFYLSFDEATSGGGYITSSTGISFMPTAAPQVYTANDAVSDASTGQVYMSMGFVYSPSPIDLTMRISQPLMVPGRIGY